MSIVLTKLWEVFLKNRFPVLLIIFFIFFTGYAINSTYVKLDSSRQNSKVFSSLIGELEYKLKPYQINRLKRKYIKIIDSIEKTRQSSNNTLDENSTDDTDENIKSVYTTSAVSQNIMDFNSLLTIYSKKYLTLPQDNTVDTKDVKKNTTDQVIDSDLESKGFPDVQSISQEQIDLQKSQLEGLKPILNDKDFADLLTLVTQMNESSAQSSPDMRRKILEVLNKYNQLNSYLILNQLCMKFDVIAYYELSGDTLVQRPLEGVSIKPISAQDQEKYKALINMQLKLFKDIHKKYFNGFFVFKDNDKSQLSYAGDFQNNQKGYLGIDAVDFSNVKSNDFERQRFYESMVKELARVVFLSSNQIDYSKSSGISDTDDFKSIKAYAKKDSYIQLFYDRFYNDLLYEDAIASYENKDSGAVNAFYLRHYYDYMNISQTIDPFRDMLQSATHFILEERPILNNVKEQKVRFFYEFSELSELRNKIQLNIKALED